MKEIYIRAKAVNGTYVYAPIGTADTYGTILIDNESLKYYNDTNGKTKLRVNGAALVDENTLTSYTDNDGKTKLKVNSAKLVSDDLYAVDNKLYVNIGLINRKLDEDLYRTIDLKLNKTAVVQNIGYDSSLIMSQRAVTENLVNKLDKTDAKKNFASLVNGKVPASQLPSYVDDVLEYDSKNDFPKPGETDKIYVDKSTNLTYRWSSNSNNYIMIGGKDLNVVQNTGNSTTDVMSQEAVTKEINNIWATINYVAPEISTFTLTPPPVSFELPATYTLNDITHKETNIANISGTLTLKRGSTVVESGISPSSTDVTIAVSDTVTLTPSGVSYTLSGTDKNGKEISKSVYVNAYYTSYIGASTSETISDTLIESFTDVSSPSLSGTRSVNISGESKYVWFVTTSTISSIKSGGFEVPHNTEVIYAYNGTIYKCYRTSSKIVAGSNTFVIE